MAHSNYQELRVYQLSEQLADRIWKLVSRWPSFARRTVGGQLVTSADSVGANIAEGAGRGSYKDNRRFILISRGSLYEVQHWLRRSYQRQLLLAEDVQEIRKIIDNLLPKLNAYLNAISRKISGRSN